MQARDLRGEFEDAYYESVLSDDIRETIVAEFQTSAGQMGFDPLEICEETRKLESTLEWLTIYNVLEQEEF